MKIRNNIFFVFLLISVANRTITAKKKNKIAISCRTAPKRYTKNNWNEKSKPAKNAYLFSRYFLDTRYTTSGMNDPIKLRILKIYSPLRLERDCKMVGSIVMLKHALYGLR
jgi:hypothetical protein